MPTNIKSNLIQIDIPAKDIPDIDAAVTTLEEKFLPHLITLTNEQRASLFKMGAREQIARDAVIAAEQNPNDIPANIGTAEAQADLAALDEYRPRFARIARLHQACEDSEMALGVDLINFALRVYALLTISAPAALKDLLHRMGGFFTRGPRKGKNPSGNGSTTPPQPSKA